MIPQPLPKAPIQNSDSLPLLSSPKHLINLCSQKEQATISLEVGDLPKGDPVINGLLLHLEELRHVNNVEILCPEGRVNPELLLLPLQAEQLIKLSFHQHKLLKKAPKLSLALV